MLADDIPGLVTWEIMQSSIDDDASWLVKTGRQLLGVLVAVSCFDAGLLLSPRANS